MNKIKIVSLVLAVIMLLPAFASCGMEKHTAENVSVVFRVPKMVELEDGTQEISYGADGKPEYEIVFTYDIPKLEETVELTDAEGNTYMAPTVLTAVEVALKKYEKDFDLSADKTYVASAFGYTEKERLDETKGYFDYWKCTINDQESSEGRQSISRVYTNDKIVFTWTSGVKDRADVTEAVTEDPDDLVVGDIDYGETEPPETTEEE